jgi:HEAT repeat protein
MRKESLGDDLLSTLSEEKAKRSAVRRIRLVNALGKLGDSKAVEPLSRVVSADPSGEVRFMAVFALGQIGDPAGAPVIRREASSRYAADQVWAIQALGRMRDRESVPLLIERLGSTDRSVRRSAADALGDIGDRAATLPLIEVLDEPYVRRAAAIALAKLGDSRALEPIRLAHQSAEGLARRRIGRALAKLESAVETQEPGGEDTSSGGAGKLLALLLERWLLPFALMAAAAWDAMKIKSKKRRLAETIDQGNRLFRARDGKRAYEREAFEFLKTAVWEFPEDPEIRLTYASILLGFRPDEVGEEAAMAVELGPDDPGFLVRAGHLLAFARRWDDVLSCVARANELVEPGFVLKAGLDNLNGILAAKDHEFERAEELLRSATEEDQVYAIDLAKFLGWRKRDAEALEVIDEALKHVGYKYSLERLRTEIAEGRYLAD